MCSNKLSNLWLIAGWSEIFLNLGLAACISKAKTWERSAGWKWKFSLFRRPVIWGEGGFVCKNQLPRFCSTLKMFKGIKRKLIAVDYLGRESESSFSPIMHRLSSDWSWWGNMVVFQESCAQPEVTIFHLHGGLSSWWRTQRHPLRRRQDPVLLLHYCFLGTPLLFLLSLPLLMNNCLNLPSETQGRSRRLKKA